MVARMAQSSLSIALEPSWRLCCGVAALHAGLVALSMGLPFGLRTIILLAVAGSALWSTAVHLWPPSPLRVGGLQWSERIGWTLHLVNGRRLPARLVGDSFVHPRLTILVFATGLVAWRSVVLVEGCARPSALRRLRVLLASQRHRGGSSG